MVYLLVLELKTRRIAHIGVTQFPTDEWTAQQLREATPWGSGPKYLIRDRNSKYARHFSAVAAGSGIQELKTSYRIGQSHLNSCGEHFEEVVFLPASLELLSMDATFGGFLLLEQVESNVA